MRTLILDIETSPLMGMAWGPVWETSILKIVKEVEIISVAWKWLGEKKVHVLAICDLPSYRVGKETDKYLMATIHALLDEADVIITQNGNAFDLKVINARFAHHQIPPPSPYLKVDTKLIAKRYFRFSSNKLNDLGVYLNEGEKERTGGFDLWLDCLRGDKKGWDKMKHYNKRDVELLEKVYLKLRPWVDNHPNYNVMNETKKRCIVCGSDKIVKHGKRVTRTGIRQAYQCRDCGAWSQGPHINEHVLLR